MQKGEAKKILIVVIVLLILILGIMVIRYQRKISLQNIKTTITPAKVQLSPTRVETFRPAYLRLSFEKGIVKVGERVSANVYFSAPERKIYGLDILVKFNPLFLQADENIKTSDYFGFYPRKKVDNEKGKIIITGIDGKDEFSSERTLIATIIFTPIREGTVSVDFEFQKGKTNLSTLVEKGTSKNILTDVQSGILDIRP